MTSKLTREENVQAVFDLKAGYTLGLADVEILKRVARMALAAMDGEPVAWQYRVSAGPATGWSLWHDGKGEQYENSYKVERRPLYRHAQPAPERDKVRSEHAESVLDTFRFVREQHAEWSDRQFGNVGPVGPLRHLAKEEIEAAEAPDDISEFADILMLVWDATRRAGFSDEQLAEAVAEKLERNKRRTWGEVKDGEPCHHVKN